MRGSAGLEIPPEVSYYDNASVVESSCPVALDHRLSLHASPSSKTPHCACKMFVQPLPSWAGSLTSHEQKVAIAAVEAQVSDPRRLLQHFL